MGKYQIGYEFDVEGTTYVVTHVYHDSFNVRSKGGSPKDDWFLGVQRMRKYDPEVRQKTQESFEEFQDTFKEWYQEYGETWTVRKGFPTPEPDVINFLFEELQEFVAQYGFKYQYIDHIYEDWYLRRLE